MAEGHDGISLHRARQSERAPQGLAERPALGRLGASGESLEVMGCWLFFGLSVQMCGNFTLKTFRSWFGRILHFMESWLDSSIGHPLHRLSSMGGLKHPREAVLPFAASC